MAGNAHTCHARNCTTVVPPRMFMCYKHWKMVPKHLQNMIWDAYVPGQEIRKDPTTLYLNVTQQAIDAVYEKETQA